MDTQTDRHRAEHVVTADRKWTAAEMNRALFHHFITRWAVLTEVTARAQYGPPEMKPLRPGAIPSAVHQKIRGERRIDVLLLRGGQPPGTVERLAIEVKVTRADFQSDVRNPDKQAPWRELAHRHAYAVPAGLVTPDQVPAGSGLLTVSRMEWNPDHHSVGWARRAPRAAGHDPGPLPMANIFDAFWRASRAEAQIKGMDQRGEDQTPDDMRAEIIRLNRELAKTSNRVAREVEAREKWQQAFAAVGAPPCGTCGKPLHPARKTGYGSFWEHRVRTDAAACEAVRRAAAVEEDNARPPDRRQAPYVYVPAPEPTLIPEMEEAT